MNKHRVFKQHTQLQGNRVLDMDDNVYKYRRMVIDSIYRVNNLLKSKGLKRLPRQEVRILSDTGRCGGMANLGGNIVTVPMNTIRRGQDYVYRIVLHELVHSVYGYVHPETDCPLMDANTLTIQDTSLDTLETVFLTYAVSRM